METFFYFLLLAVLWWLLSKVLSARRNAIKSPKLGFMNLMGDLGAKLVEEDRAAFFSLFDSPVDMSREISACDVLLLYCELDPDGRLKGSTGSLDATIRSSGARVVIVASENGQEGYAAAARQSSGVNLVMTLRRKGAAFPAFFARLFSEMLKGTSMPIAWNRLAPQIPGQPHPDTPDTICLMGAGQVRFK
jgi:hypothetical protein